MQVIVDAASFVDVRHSDSLKVLRVGAVGAIYRIPTVQSVVDAVTRTIEREAKLLPVTANMTNMRVMCDATECRSRDVAGSREATPPREVSPPSGGGVDDKGVNNVVVRLQRTILDNIKRTSVSPNVFTRPPGVLTLIASNRQ